MPRCAAFLKYADQGSVNDQHRSCWCLLMQNCLKDQALPICLKKLT